MEPAEALPRDQLTRAFGRPLRQSVQDARELAAQAIGGFDERRWIKLQLNLRFDPGGTQIATPGAPTFRHLESHAPRQSPAIG